MRKGFTLLELMIVLIIVGVLSTLAISQYTTQVEKSRGAEARVVIGRIRGICASVYMEQGSASTCDNAYAKIGATGTSGIAIPGVAAANCAGSNWFWYSITTGANGPTILATRCTSGGKNPVGAAAYTMQDVVDFRASATSDTWSYDTTNMYK